MSFELRDEKLENLEEYEEINLENKRQVQVTKGWTPHAVDIKGFPRRAHQLLLVPVNHRQAGS